MNRIEQLQEFIETDPENVFLYYALGLEFVAKNEKTKAKEYFDKVLQLDENYLAVYYQYAKLSESLNETKKAKELYAKGIEVAKEQNNALTLRELQSAYDELLFE